MEFSTIKEEFTKSILSYVANFPEGIWQHTLYQLETDPSGLFIKYYLLSLDAGENNINLVELMMKKKRRNISIDWIIEKNSSILKY